MTALDTVETRLRDTVQSYREVVNQDTVDLIHTGEGLFVVETYIKYVNKQQVKTFSDYTKATEYFLNAVTCVTLGTWLSLEEDWDSCLSL